MVFARLAEYLSPSSPSLTEQSTLSSHHVAMQRERAAGAEQDVSSSEILEEEKRHPLLHVRSPLAVCNHLSLHLTRQG